MAEDVQGLIVLTEGDRFVSIGRAGRARVWRIDLTGEALEDVDRTGAAPPVTCPDRGGPWHDGDEVDSPDTARKVPHAMSNKRVGQDYTLSCTCGWSQQTPVPYQVAVARAAEHLEVMQAHQEVDRG